MLDMVWLVLIGLSGGVAVGVQAPISGLLGQRLGGLASSFIVHLTGMALSGVLLLISQGENIRDWKTVPWYMLLGGFLGVVLVKSVTVTVPRLGATSMVMLIIVGQLLTGMLLDHFGLLGMTQRPIDLARVIGAGVLLVGGYLITR